MLPYHGLPDGSRGQKTYRRQAQWTYDQGGRRLGPDQISALGGKTGVNPKSNPGPNPQASFFGPAVVLISELHSRGKMPTTILPDTTEETTTRQRVETIPPYKVILLNDDVTTMEFVVRVLVTIFKKDPATAVTLMLEIHQTGAAVIEILSLEEAEHRQQLVHSAAQAAGFPLRCVIEPA